MSSMWMIRAGRGGENLDDFIQKGVVALGDEQLGPLSPSIRKDELIRLFAEKYPEMKEGSRTTWASQFARFVSEIKVHDAVTTFDRERRLYFLGNITSEYEWAPTLIGEKPHIRRVKWTHQVARDLLGAGTRNTLGAIQTLFKLSSEAADDLNRHKVPIGTAVVDAPSAVTGSPEDEEEAAQIRASNIEKADEFIEDAISRLDWMQMQELVAGILRAMGYRTVVSAPGADRGVDIFASPDGLGLQEPRIFVEVKHRTQSMGSKEIRAFLGGRKKGDRCLYVSIGGFSKDAHYEADRSEVPLTLIALPALRALLVEHYEAIDAETRSLVPLKKLYWPVT